MPAAIPVTPEILILAYRQGIFPMARSRRGAVDWYSPDPRAILPLDGFHVPQSLGRRYRSGRFRITQDLAFGRVIRACSEPRRYEKETWINPAIINAYSKLHEMRLAHSVEAWLPRDAKLPPGEMPAGAEDDRFDLVGGLYGVSLGGAFFGESMFSRATDASKVCLVALVEHLRERGFVLLDVQCNSPHMETFGAVEVPREDFLRVLAPALEVTAVW